MVGRIRVGSVAPGMRRVAFAAAVACALAAAPRAMPAEATPIARVVSAQGTVEAQRAGAATWDAVKLGDGFAAGDAIRVGPRSRADVSLGRSVLRVNENTSLQIKAPKEQRTSVVDLVKGAVHFLSRGPSSLEVQTAYTVAGVRGTEFLVAVEADRTLLTVFEGTVEAENSQGRLRLAGGQSGVAEAGKAPALRAVARPRDAVTWTLYYPPVVEARPDAFAGDAGWHAKARQSVEAYRRGDLKGAFAALDDVPTDASDPRLATYRAQLLLAVGRADEAGEQLRRALAASPDDAGALALQSVAAVVQGDREQGLQRARKAVEAAPRSAAALLALSYAQQARFDLEGARASVERAVQAEPRNALAWARLSELHASFGDLGKSRDAAEQAAALDPNLSRTQTVLGFSELMRIDVGAAKAAFEKAIALDSADPMPRLGLGLAKIRGGNLDEGGRDVESAVSLDPNDALVRSYLGKTYYEQKDSPRDERELATAKQLDPNDPTPWLYDAIAKQTTNRPVEALQDLERSIELNDDRAVYRSRLLLDSDAAARSASLARVYTDLGFQQLALVEGWSSVNVDPSSSAAHRFLADTYSILPRHQIARVSELLQSQLLQPVSLTPIPPRLGESNLFLISAGGPTAASFNEYSSLFNRDGYALQLGGLAGEQGTYRGEAVASALVGKLALGVGYSYFDTDGWRTNAHERDHLVTAFAQYDLTPATSLQAEYRYRKLDQGDLRQLFYPNAFYPGQQEENPIHSVRLGGRHAFAPNSMLLANAAYQDSRDDVSVPDFVGPGSSIAVKLPQKAASGELQYLHRLPWLNVRAGAGYFHVDGTLHTTFVSPPQPPDAPPPPPDAPPPGPIESTSSAVVKHVNGYVYGDVRPLRTLVVTLGASYDHVEADQTRSQGNPKLGVTWNPLPGTTLRGAVFRVVKRTLVTNQTLEPTEVAGFNQFYDDADLTEAWKYGVAFDQKIARTFFVGAEGSRRDLKVPTVSLADPANPVNVSVDWKEWMGRGYAFWTPHPWFALSAEYLFERFERADLFSAGIRDLKTHRVPFGVRFFHPIGVSASVTENYWHQSGRFEDFVDSTLVTADRETFWTTDAALSYRLPRRYGFVTAGATNLFDKRFRYYEVDVNNSRVLPVRTLYARLTVQLP